MNITNVNNFNNSIIQSDSIYSNNINFIANKSKKETDNFVKKVISENNNKNLKAKILIATGAIVTAAIAVGSYFRKPKPFANKIEFKPLNNLKEVKDFVKTKFGIKSFDIGDLDTANFINEGLINLHNRFRGKAKMPSKIQYVKNIVTSDGREVLAGYKDKNIFISHNFLENRIIKNRNISYAEALKEYAKQHGEGNFQWLYHEIGHLNHEASGKNFHRLYSVAELKAKGIEDIKISQEFSSNMNMQKTAALVSESAKFSPGEFVAEVFAKIAYGEKLPKKVMTLYKKYQK